MIELSRTFLRTLVILCLGVASTANATIITATFNDNNEKLLGISSDWDVPSLPFTPGDAVDQPFEITNNTTDTWVDFHFRIANSPGESLKSVFFNLASGGFDGTAYEGPGTFTIVDPGPDAGQLLEVKNLVINPGDIFAFNLDIEDNGALFDYSLFGEPYLLSPSPVPEPSTIVLWSLGALAFAGLGLQRKRAA